MNQDNHCSQAGYPLTLSQLEIYFDQAKDPSSTAYNTGGYARIFRSMDVEAMQKAIHLVAEQHDVFHLAFEEVGEQIIQTYKYTPAKIKYLEFDQHKHPLAAARTWVEEQFKRVFDLSKHGLYSTHILKVAEDEYWLVLYAHHLILDGLSYSIWTENIFDYYIAQTKGEDLNLEQSQPQFNDLAQKSYKYPETKSFTRSADFWNNKFDDVFEPVIKPRYPKKAGEASTCMVSQEISPEYYKQLVTFSESLGFTIHQLFIGALYGYFLGVNCNRTIPICLPFHNRTGSAKNAIGCFASVSPLVLNIEPAMTFRQLMDDISSGLKAISRHTKYPMSKVIQGMRSTQPYVNNLFDINFNYYKASFNIGEGEFESETHSLRTGHQPPFKFHLCEFKHQQEIQIECQTSYFNDSDAKAILERIRLIIEQVVANPNIQLADLELTTEKDLASYARLNQRTESHQITNPSIVELYEQQTTFMPDANALVFAEQSLSFQQLDHKANQLANKLRSLGANKGNIIGLCVERSLEMLIGLMGILKAGAAYLPLDPKAPAERIKYIIENANLDTVVTSHKCSLLLPDQVSKLVQLDEAMSEKWLSKFTTSAPEKNISNNDTAYVIYTSGSTGYPKGVEVSHENLANLTSAMHTMLTKNGLSGNCKWAWNAPLYFDASVQAITQLALGAELHLISDEHRVDPSKLTTYLHEHSIDVLDTTPTMLEVLLPEAQKHHHLLPNLLIGGEAINPNLWHEINKHTEQSGRFALNVYGPTECTVNSSWANLKISDKPTIGHSLPGTQLFVINESLQPLPVGIIGELVIAGPGVAKGYLNNTTLTEKAFIDHLQLGRIYRSGDLVSLGEDGKLEYIGRRDFQVKLRGNRIELEEIENVLCRHEFIIDAAIVIKDEQIQAIVVAEKVSEEELNRHIKSQLPDYMHISHYVFIDAMPITANGKKDRAALAKIDSQQGVESYLAPTSNVETQIQQIWSNLLQKEQISIGANFFEIGGHSLLAIRVASACRDLFKVEVKLSEFIEAPTIRSLAEKISHVIDRQEAVSQVIDSSLVLKNNKRIIL